MIRLGATASLALVLAAAPLAEAKFRIYLRVGSAQPRAGQPVRVSVRIGHERIAGTDVVMRLLALAPGAAMYPALQDESAGRDPAPSFRVHLVRHGYTWTGVARFPSPGGWQLIVPNWGAPGYAIPPPVVRALRVR